MMMRYSLASMVVGVLLVGCAPRSELEATKALLEECRTDKVSAQVAAESCEERYARDVRRWQSLDEIASTL